MNIEKILNEIRFINEDLQIICSIPSANIRSRIYLVGQVQEDIPGVVLGNREPELREKTIGEFKKELTTFGNEFSENHFLIESTLKINKINYELRYYKLTHIKVKSSEVILYSETGEVTELRELLQETEYD